MATDYSPILKGILSAASSRMNTVGRPPGRVELTPGLLPAWDDCCAGQLYLRTVSFYPTMGASSPFPQLDSAQAGVSSQCAVNMMAFELGLGILRCAATLDDEGEPPTSAAVTADADLILADMSDLLDVIVCEVPGLPGIKKMKLGRWTPQGPLGGCAGGEWQLYVAIDPCLCQPIPEGE